MSGFIPAPALALPALLSAAGATDPVVWYSWDPNPLLEPGPARSQAHTFALFSYSMHENTPEEQYSAPVFTPRAQTDFLRAHQCLETQTDTQEAPSSAPGTTPLFQAHKHLFPSPKMQPQALGSAGTGAGSPVEGLEPCSGPQPCAPRASPAPSAHVAAASAPSPSVGHRNWPRVLPGVG